MVQAAGREGNAPDASATSYRYIVANRAQLWRHDHMVQFPSIPEVLESALLALRPGAIVVGYSGGGDSLALLDALAHSANARSRGLRALHIDHGLHAGSVRWAEHCAQIAVALNVPFETVRVTVDSNRNGGLEDAARGARMEAFAQRLGRNEWLALAHHRDDQAETILLKLLRGAGPEGLGGMRTMRQCGKGMIWRPLLDTPQRVLKAYALTPGLGPVEDPSNADRGLRRNFLRHEIFPRLQQRWVDPQAALAHSAQWARAAAQFISLHTHQALASLRSSDGRTLAWRGWLALHDALRDQTLRLWLRELQLDEPNHLHVAELSRQLQQAGLDRQPCVTFGSTQLRRYRDRLHALEIPVLMPDAWNARWNPTDPLALPDGSILTLQSQSIPLHAQGELRVCYRSGGERIKPAGHAHSRALRLLLQESGIPPWQRDRVPLIYHDAELLGVGDFVLSDAGRAFCTDRGAQFIHTPPVRVG